MKDPENSAGTLESIVSSFSFVHCVGPTLHKHAPKRGLALSECLAVLLFVTLSSPWIYL